VKVAFPFDFLQSYTLNARMHFRLLLLVVWLGGVLLTSVQAASSPQDQFLQLYFLIQEGEKLESESQKSSAYVRYEESLKRLKALQKEFPDWEPSIVSFRIRYVTDKLSQLESFKGGGSEVPTTPTIVPPSAPDGTVPPVVPGGSDDPLVLKGRIKDLEGELAETKTKLAEAVAETTQLRAKLEGVEKELTNAKAGNVDGRIAKLLQENNSLKSQLVEAENQLKTLQGGSGSQQSVPLLEAQLKKVQDNLAILEQENTAFKQTTAELRSQLEKSQKELAEASAKSGSGDGEARRENDLLRGIINRQLQEQARRDAAKKLAAEELTNLKVQSQVLRQQIDILGSPVVVLSDEEKALLRMPTDVTVPTEEPSFVAPLKRADEPSPTTPAGPEGTPAAPLPSAPDNTPPSPNDIRTQSRVPADMRPLAQEASDLVAQQRFDEATQRYRQILEKYPDSLYAWSNLGVVQFKQQKYEEAIKSFSQSTKLNPYDAFSYSNLGVSYFQLGKVDDAITALTRAAALDDKDARTQNYLGIACSQKGWLEAAEQKCRRAIELDPNFADPHFNLAVIYATQKPPAKELARRHYKQALDLGIPKDAQLEKLLE
jgi:tetratricopeptide (TPR) repeat protein